jgi:integrase
MPKSPATKRGKKTISFRIGRVRAYLRGRVWYLCYHEQGKRHQPRVGPDRELARKTAAEINAQLEVGVLSTLGFEPISILELRDRWLQQHEYVRRTSVCSIRRYHAATQHFVNFISGVCPLRRASDVRPRHAEEFVRYLRSIKTSPNGHQNARRRPLRDNSIKYILESCRALFGYAQRHRHLSPYAENPFRTIEIGRMPIEDAKPIVVFTEEQERRFLEACDEWQFPVFLTLLMTGMRPGEITHLLLPDDLDLEDGWLHVRNKPGLGWQVKTRTERSIPLVPELVDLLRRVVGDRRDGPVFRQRRCSKGYVPPLEKLTSKQLEHELAKRVSPNENASTKASERELRDSIAKTVWRETGAIYRHGIRYEFIKLTTRIGLPEVTAPKTLRHTFATCLQDANVDPLIRNELMGHSPAGLASFGNGLGMTGVYTHTRPETKRRQLEDALRRRPCVVVARDWLAAHASPAAFSSVCGAPPKT